MTRPGLQDVVRRIGQVVSPGFRVGIEAAGHYHRAVLAASAWPSGWEVLELNPAHVTEQRRVSGRRRVKTDAIDLEAITERCWRTSRFVRFAATRGLQVRRLIAERLVTAARDALPSPEAPVARQVLAADLALLADLDRQVGEAEQQLAVVLPASPFNVLTSVRGWGTVRSTSYGAAVGDPSRWPGPAQLYRAAGLSPVQYESAGRRRDGAISREGSVELRRALIELDIGLWHNDPASQRYAAGLRARGKHSGVISCALAHHANRIAFALVRDQTSYDPTRWS